MCDRDRPRRFLNPLLVLGLGCLLVVPSALGMDEAQAPRALLLAGKLQAKKVDGARTFLVVVGKRSYRLTGDEKVLAQLGKLARKSVTVRGPVAPTDVKHEYELTIASVEDIGVQKPAAVAGTVRVDAESGSKPEYFLESDEGDVWVHERSARKFKAFVGVHVEAIGHVRSDDQLTLLEGVTKVARKLLPGERDPRKANEALAGKWGGTFTATEVPNGVPAEPGDYPASFSASESLEGVTGRLMRTYDIVGLKVRKWNLRKRTIEFDLDYDFGQGSSSVRCRGAFGPDWKVLSGDWTSGALGKGTFRLTCE